MEYSEPSWMETRGVINSAYVEVAKDNRRSYA